MKKKRKDGESNADLRRRAVQRLKERQPDQVASTSEHDLQRLVHELQVHQIELEMQNEELQRAHRALEESLAQYAELYDFAPVGYFTLDGSSKILRVNLAGARLLGLERSKLLGECFSRFVSEKDHAAFDRFLARVLTATDCASSEVMLDAAKPLHLHIEGRLGPPQEGQGPQGRIVAIDISERKRAEAERTRITAQLYQSQKLESIGTLAGGVAHDFNNQLVGILGFADLLSRDLTDEKMRSYAKHILAAARRSAELTRRLLAFARKGKQQVNHVDVHATVAEVAALLGQSIDKRIAIRQCLNAHSYRVLGDAEQLHSAILNLALNARDAMPDGGRLIFETRNLDAAEPEKCMSSSTVEESQLEISVSDTGVGMSEEMVDRVFDPFFTTKAQCGGTGLGLASVYGTIQSHQGSIVVESKPGNGSVFRIYLPLASAAESGHTHATEKRDFRSPAMHVLVVDDEEVVRVFVLQLLKASGHRVTVCRDGEEALEFFREHWQKVDLAILDMMMPGMLGKDLYRAMRRINPHVKVLLASGYSVEKESQALLDEGVLGFAQKPFTAAEFSRAMGKALSRETRSP